MTFKDCCSHANISGSVDTLGRARLASVSKTALRATLRLLAVLMLATHAKQVAVLACSLLQAVLHLVFEALSAHTTQALDAIDHRQAHNTLDLNLGFRGRGGLRVQAAMGTMRQGLFCSMCIFQRLHGCAKTLQSA